MQAAAAAAAAAAAGTAAAGAANKTTNTTSTSTAASTNETATTTIVERDTATATVTMQTKKNASPTGLQLSISPPVPPLLPHPPQASAPLPVLEQACWEDPVAKAGLLGLVGLLGARESGINPSRSAGKSHPKPCWC